MLMFMNSVKPSEPSNLWAQSTNKKRHTPMSGNMSPWSRAFCTTYLPMDLTTVWYSTGRLTASSDSSSRRACSSEHQNIAIF